MCVGGVCVIQKREREGERVGLRSVGRVWGKVRFELMSFHGLNLGDNLEPFVLKYIYG